MTPSTASQATIELAPSYRLAAVVTLLGIGLGGVNLWVGGAIALFGLFLILQTTIIRLKFTPDSLEVYRSQTLIRSFPYPDWQDWYIFWKGIPLLFFFREVKSIHFLPILFDANQLRACLENHCPKTDL